MKKLKIKKLRFHKINISSLNKINGGNGDDQISIFFEDNTACYTSPTVCLNTSCQTNSCPCPVTVTTNTSIDATHTCAPGCGVGPN
ncbi:hypothetical protein GTQ40_13035 [Flavobacteriaceae bacterium R38]|nr:hypothetical protein [Flavobacteriaceae bacterium R38]